MSRADTAIDKLLSSLQERAKELSCLYEIEQILNCSNKPLDEAFQAVVAAIPPGWKYPDICCATIEYRDRIFPSAACRQTPTEWVMSADIVVQDQVVGKVNVYYLEERPREAIGPFLRDEERLVRTIADRLSHFILFQQLSEMYQRLEEASQCPVPASRAAWKEPIALLRRFDRKLFIRIARKLLNHLCWLGVEEAKLVLQAACGGAVPDDPATSELNSPVPIRGLDTKPLLSGKPFELAAGVLSDDEILSLIQRWVMEDKASFFLRTVFGGRSTLPEIVESLRRFHHVLAEGAELSEPTMNGLRVALIRRFLTDHLEMINVAKQHLDTTDFEKLLERVIVISDSDGKLGGKSTGLLLASRILAKAATDNPLIGEVKVPKSWYIASDGLMAFIMYNEAEEVLEQKYRDVARVRQEYPNIVQLFKSSPLPPDIVRGLAMALDDFGDVPIIVRSSSLLEDRYGTAFSGKYKSLFLANQGSKQERLSALLDAVTEIYASVFGPDPIEYRRERGLVDFHEEMAILIQEVVGVRCGDYFLPALAGVAFSNNELRWSPRIKRTDGLIRMVPGLGTRAVDRTADDYPILVVPAQPKLRVNTSIDEVIRYAPRQADVINLETGRFESLELSHLLRTLGTTYPAFTKVFSVLKDELLQRPVPIMVNPEKDQLLATFDGLIESTPFISKLDSILKTLAGAMQVPVDIEFAFDGTDFYLLQCRPQSYSGQEAPAPIPKDLPARDVLFSANRYVSNGQVPDISHIVYVDPERYSLLSSRSEMLAVGEAVSKLNKLLPKRKFVLMGPGRWGSRGDIRLGVSVTYSDINNTAMLIEIARQRGGYLPDLSFGTHFFQDLVEAAIRYLPLYPDDEGGSLNQQLLLEQPNLLAEMLPDLAWLSDVVHVIDVPAVTGGRVLRVLMNADLNEAAGILVDPESSRNGSSSEPVREGPPSSDDAWRWRRRMAEQIAATIEAERLGVRAMYLFGSTKNASAGPASDIDLLVHFDGDDSQHELLMTWLDGWSRCLGEINYLRTGYNRQGLLDVHVITDDDIRRQTSYAAKINAVTDAARELSLTEPASDHRGVPSSVPEPTSIP
jgi:hypothetical protein